MYRNILLYHAKIISIILWGLLSFVCTYADEGREYKFRTMSPSGGLGYDGIKFKSTLVDGGTNYAIFNEKKFECTNVKVVQIGNIDYNWSPL